MGTIVEDVEHPNVGDEPESAIFTEIEREELQENFDANFEEGPSPVDMEGEKSAVVDPDEDAALVQIEEGTIAGAKSKAEDEHLCNQAEQEGRQLNAEEYEAEHKYLATRLDNGGEGFYLHGEAKVVEEEEEEERTSAYEELCQQTAVQPEQARLILANRESDTVETEPNSCRPTIIVQTANANINASKEEEIDTGSYISPH